MYTHAQSTCVGMIAGLMEAGGTENLWTIPPKIEVKTQSYVTTANVTLAGEEAC